MQNKTAGSGASRRRGDRDLGNRPEHFRSDQQSHRPVRPGLSVNTNAEGIGQPVHQRVGQTVSAQGAEIRDGGQQNLNHHLIHLTMCLIGQPVEVHTKSGSIYSGVFHTANAEKDFGVVLKVARLIRDGSSRGRAEAALARRPEKILVIRAKDLVQIVAKDAPLSGESLQSGRARENRADIITDSFLSQGKQLELERELQPWTPDNTDSRDLQLDSTFQNTRHRKWDQFETNKNLFGVESTFDETLYTTKLQRGPQMREREKEALRIAREIEGQKNVHMAEDGSGIDDFDLSDEENRFSSVLRPSEDSTEEYRDTNSVSVREAEHRKFKGTNLVIPTEEESSIDSSAQTNDSTKPQGVGGGNTITRMTQVAGFVPVLVGGTTSMEALNLDIGCAQLTEEVYRDFNEFRQQESAKRGKKLLADQVSELKSFSERLKDLNLKQQGAKVAGVHNTAGLNSTSTSASHNATTVSGVSSAVDRDSGALITVQSRCSSTGSSEELTRVGVVATEAESAELPYRAVTRSLSTQSSCEIPIIPSISVPPTTTPLSPSSSSGKSDSKKSSLNSSAKEFRLNPNAKAFTPSATPVRSPSPAVQGPLYVPGAMSSVAQTQGMPVNASVNPLSQPVGQFATTKYAPYNPVAVATSSGANPYVPSPGPHALGTSGATVSPNLGGGQSRGPPLPQTVSGQSYGSQQPARYTSQSPAVQPTAPHVHPNSHLYAQHMMYGQGGQQIVFFHPIQVASPQPAGPTTSSQQPQQPRHRGGPTTAAGVQGVHGAFLPHFMPGQQQFLPQVQVASPLQVLVPAAAVPPAIQPPQGIGGAIVAPAQQQPNTGTSSGARVMRVSGRYIGGNFQQ